MLGIHPFTHGLKSKVSSNDVYLSTFLLLKGFRASSVLCGGFFFMLLHGNEVHKQLTTRHFTIAIMRATLRVPVFNYCYESDDDGVRVYFLLAEYQFDTFSKTYRDIIRLMMFIYSFCFIVIQLTIVTVVSHS